MYSAAIIVKLFGVPSDGVTSSWQQEEKLTKSTCEEKPVLEELVFQLNVF